MDWDGVMLAPRERDLMFYLGDDTKTAFLDGYGDVSIHELVLSFYRHEWLVNEISDYAGQVMSRALYTKKIRSNAFAAFGDLFSPGSFMDGIDDKSEP